VPSLAHSPEESAKKVYLAGSFNNWKPISMSKQKSGQFIRIMKLSAGTYEYKFIIDGVWRHDCDHGNPVLNSLGSLNSVVVVN
jgi:1,4-alpha-glucan branching enzyme